MFQRKNVKPQQNKVSKKQYTLLDDAYSLLRNYIGNIQTGEEIEYTWYRIDPSTREQF